MSQSPPSSVFRRLWKPASLIGVGGTASAVWFEELILYAEAILGLIILTIMGGLFYLFNFLVFKSRLPKRDDLNIKTTGEKN